MKNSRASFYSAPARQNSLSASSELELQAGGVPLILMLPVNLKIFF